MEVLDLYDDYFNPLNKTVRRRIDEIPEGSNIMTSYIIIKNNEKYLMQKMGDKDNYKWSLSGGHVLSGESAEEALIRELFEELRLVDINFNYIDTVKFPYNHYIFNIFSTEDQIDIEKLTMDNREVTDLAWFSKEELYNMINSDEIPRGYAYIIENYIK